MKPRMLLPAAGFGVLLAGCAVGPDYRRPAVDVPAGYRGPDTPPAGGEAGPAAGQTQADLGAAHWGDLFPDPVLKGLIDKALTHNYDVRIAASRVLEARAALGVTRAQQLPSLSLGAGAFNEGVPAVPDLSPSYREKAGSVSLAVLWNLDFWGKYRRQSEAARAELLGTQWGQRAVHASVVADVASAYFRLQAMDAAQRIARSTVESRSHSLQLIQVLARNGSASQLDVHQAEQLLYTATQTVTDLERQIVQEENALSMLLGENPGPVARGQALADEVLPAAVPAGLPSELLERRPDVGEAEAALVAANARVGVAKAAFFPSLSLTGTGGYQSTSLGSLFNPGARLWDGAAQLTEPLFQGGAIVSGYRLSQAQREERLLTYRQTVQNAFREVSDALVAYQKGREFRDQQEKLTLATRETARLSNVLYRQGGASYLQVLTSETSELAAQLALVQAQLNERLAFVQLFNALGGGWTP